MIDNTDDKMASGEFSQEAGSPNSGPESNARFSKLTDLGKKGLGPVLEVLQRHRGDLGPYVSAINRAFEASLKALDTPDATAADRTVSSWVQEASTWFSGLKQKFEAKNSNDLLTFIQQEAQNRPGLMFAFSYLAGMGLGRLGKYTVDANQTTVH